MTELSSMFKIHHVVFWCAKLELGMRESKQYLLKNRQLILPLYFLYPSNIRVNIINRKFRRSFTNT